MTGPATGTAFGSSVTRKEDLRLLRGEGAYLDDLGREALAVAFVRSPHASARIEDIDVTAALEVRGLVAVYAYEDLPGRLQQPLPVTKAHAALTHPRTTHLLAPGVVRHVGEAVAMVVAADRYVAEDVVARIDVAYEPLPTVVGLETAARADRSVHDDVPDNRAGHLVQEVGDARAAIETAPHRLAFRLSVERSASTPLEPRGVLARWDASDSSLTVYSSTQNPTGVRAAVAGLLDLPAERVDCIAPDTGGGFGVKNVYPWVEEILLPWAARTLDRSLKWTEDRREHFISATHERGQIHDVEVGFDDDGRVLGLSVRFLHDTGAYTPYGIVVPLITAAHIPGPYRLGAHRVEFDSLYTNTCPVAPYRGAGRPQAAFCIERTMDRIARHLDRDRTAVRAANLIQPHELPYDVGLPYQDGRPMVYDSGDYPAALAMVKEMIGWDNFSARKAEAARAGRRLGIGIACYLQGSGVGPYEGAHVQVQASGRVTVATGLSSQGQGHHTMLAQIVADELGVAYDDVHVTTGDTRRARYSAGTFASRAAVVSGNAAARAARGVRSKALRIAAEALEASPGDLEIVDQAVRVKGSPETAVPLRTVAALANPLRYAFDEQSKLATQFAAPASADAPPLADGASPGLEETAYFSPQQATFANGAHGAVVETDPDTAEIRILQYVVVHDCGRIVNPDIVKGQLHGGVAQGMAGALYERIAYDEHGQLLNANLADFLMPYSTEVPHVEIAHLESPSPLNPLGIKGAGEAGVIPAAATIAAAIEDAEGLEIDSVPISPSDLHALRFKSP